jgi:hypothetical protein
VYTSAWTMPWHTPVFLLNSRLGRFSAAGLCSPWRVTYCRHPLSRSYGVILPSSFSVNHSSTLGFSPRPPVSDYGTVNCSPGLRSFSRQYAAATLGGAIRPLRHRLSTIPADLPTGKRLPPCSGKSTTRRSPCSCVPPRTHNGLQLVREC